jgi:hypothetical protein
MTIWVRVLAACAGVLMIVSGFLALVGNIGASLVFEVAAVLVCLTILIFLLERKRSS